MCMLVDANLIPIVFKSSNYLHNKYKPIINWLLYGKGKLVFGGYYFEKEIKESLIGFMPLIKELTRLNKTHYFSNEDVDVLTKEIKNRIKDTDFNDPHLVALLIISKATVFCSNDKKSFKFIKEKSLYPKGQNMPRIFSASEHIQCKNILNNNNICSNGEHKILPKSLADRINKKI
jgi:hypothetical protein